MKISLILFTALFLSGCATMGEHYSENTAKVQSCMEDTLVAVIGLPLKGFGAFEKLCEKRN